MIAKPPIPPDEAERLEAVRKLFVLDSEPEPLFDGITRLASEICGVPIALVSLVDAERQWFKANTGLPGFHETPRDVAFCAYAVMDDAVLEVPDATRDDRFSGNPLVTGAPDIRFYTGVPLVLPRGERVGTLCVIDRETRRLSPAQLSTLRALADMTSRALVMRRDLIGKSLAVRTEYERALSESETRYRNIVEEQSELVSLARADGELVYVNPAYARYFGCRPADMVGKSLLDFVEVQDREAVRALTAQVLQSGKSIPGENRMVSPDGVEKWIAWSNSLQRDAEQRPMLHSVGRDVTERKLADRALRELTAIFDNTPDYVVQTGWNGNIRYMNPAARRLIGLEVDAPVTSRNFAEFNTAQTNRTYAEEILPSVKTSGVWIGKTTVYGRDRVEIPVNHMVIAHRNADGRIDRYSAVMRDIATELQAAQLQQRMTATLRAITEAMPALVSVVGSDERYRFVNTAFERWWKAPRDSIVGRAMSEVLGAAEYEGSRPWVQRALTGETVSFEKASLTREGTRHVKVHYVPLWLESGDVDGFIVVVEDITQQKQEELRLLQLTQRDKLTGLLNRAGFEDHLERQISLGDTASMALLYIDLDHFKPINDQYGHPVGDQVLQIFAQRVQKLVRASDAVVRLGGDEFAVVLSGVPKGVNAQVVAEKVIAAAHAPFSVDGHQLQIGASIGIAFGVDPAAGWRELVARADTNLYKAKAAGRGRQAG